MKALENKWEAAGKDKENLEEHWIMCSYETLYVWSQGSLCELPWLGVLAYT